jgi:hypothetical protein
MEDLMLVRYIKENFKAICNIKVMRKNQKREVLIYFQDIFKKHKAIKIPFTMQTGIDDSNSLLLPR